MATDSIFLSYRVNIAFKHTKNLLQTQSIFRYKFKETKKK